MMFFTNMDLDHPNCYNKQLFLITRLSVPKSDENLSTTCSVILLTEDRMREQQWWTHNYRIN